MSNLNSVLIEGTLLDEPLFRYTPKGSLVCTFRIVNSRREQMIAGGEMKDLCFTIEAWGRLADMCEKYGKKGRGIRVVGTLKQDRWTGTDGKPHEKISIVAEHVEWRPKVNDSTEGKKHGKNKEA
jgi:single-strand DNA-binding protein